MSMVYKRYTEVTYKLSVWVKDRVDISIINASIVKLTAHVASYFDTCRKSIHHFFKGNF